jgi:hypothetical protein
MRVNYICSQMAITSSSFTTRQDPSERGGSKARMHTQTVNTSNENFQIKAKRYSWVVIIRLATKIGLVVTYPTTPVRIVADVNRGVPLSPTCSSPPHQVGMKLGKIFDLIRQQVKHEEPIVGRKLNVDLQLAHSLPHFLSHSNFCKL